MGSGAFHDKTRCIYALSFTSDAPGCPFATMYSLNLSLWGAAIAAAVVLIGLRSWLSSRRRQHVRTTDGRLESKEEREALIPGSSLPDPDPLVNFDLKTATARNFVYANKTVRYPYYQVKEMLSECTRLLTSALADYGTSAHACQPLDRDRQGVQVVYRPESAGHQRAR